LVQIRPLPGIGEDYDWMAALVGGDSASLERLYDRYSGVVYAICLRVIGDHAEAEDCLIGVFWELWNRADRYDAGRAAPLTYITTLARSRAIDRRRSNISRGTLGISLDPTAESAVVASVPSTEPDPSAGAVLDELRGQIRQAIATLDPAQREALECSYFDGLSHSQIAEKLGKPLGTVKTCIRQGLIQMRQKLRVGASEQGDA
jgi:RNA polymerase sigma-70 factor (ECF subfamily)